MPQTDVSLTHSCQVEIEFRLPGKPGSERMAAILDTGFFHDTVGLALPIRFRSTGENRPKGTVSLTLANGRSYDFGFDPGVEILKIGDIELDSPIPVGTAFTKSKRVFLGMKVLRKGVLHVDGPGSRASFQLA